MAALWRAPTILAGFRRHRTTGVALFTLLVLFVAGERRLADLHFNQRTAAPALENDLPDGDEIRLRLLAFNDDTPPTLSRATRAVGFAEPTRDPVPHDALGLGFPTPRGPPLPASLA